MKNIYSLAVAIALAFLGFGISLSAHAATLSLLPPSSAIAIGDKVTLDLRVDSQGTSFNAAQATIRFPKDMLEVVSLDKTESALSFWLEEPRFSNTDGVISFTGGTSYGVSGGAVDILKVQFRAKGSGSGSVSFTEGAITAADGSGTNILSRMSNAVISVTPSEVTPTVVAPQPIVRTPTVASGLPAKPVIKIPLYPEDGRWYDSTSSFTASWDLPSDISAIAIALDQSPNTIPPTQSKGLFDSKTFDALTDGIWYLHVQFKNNIGWGATAHYKIAIDTKPPLGFQARVLEGDKTDNPALTLQFNTTDALSGVKEYQVKVDDEALIRVPARGFTGSFALPLQPPGEKRILVKAIDLADNSVESAVSVDVLPIASPSITSVPSRIIAEDQQGITVKGTAIPGIDVVVKVQRSIAGGGGEVVATTVVRADEKGNWEASLGNQALQSGRYQALAQSRDTRGALSFVVASPDIQVAPKPIIQIGIFELGPEGAIVLLLIVLVCGFGSGVWFYKRRQGKIALRVGVAESEISKIFGILSDDLEGISRSAKTLATSDDEFALKKLQEDIKKMEVYLRTGVKKIKR